MSDPTATSIIEFVLSEGFEKYIIDTAVEQKKVTVRKYLADPVISGSANEVRFTQHDMQRGAMLYLDMFINDLITKAQTHISTIDIEKEKEKYTNRFNALQSAQNKLKDFI